MSKILQITFHRDDGRGMYHDFFMNYVHEKEQKLSVKGGMRDWIRIRRMLADEYRATIDRAPDLNFYLVFEREEDAVEFALRWS